MIGQNGLVRTGISVLLLATAAQASYHYIHYAGRTSPFNPIYEKYNLAALPNNTLTFFVADQGPSSFAVNDSFGSVLSQIKQAVAAWNSVSTSDLRVAFGGLESYTPNPSVAATGSPTISSATPGADVIFVDLPPGLRGLSAPTTSTVAVNGPNGSFFPIVRGLVMLSRDTTLQQPGPSYMESFFTTAVHEIGHALGLQHTWTASAMSAATIRNTSRTRPLDADDVAGISILYGKANWQANYGSISGRVTFANGAGVTLASVVAIASNGPAVSTLTSPDGTYRIDGLPTNYNYLVYAHPLPPGSTDSSGLRLPVDGNAQQFTSNGAFQTQFYPGTLDPSQAIALAVRAGVVSANINFNVQPRGVAAAYDVVTYGWLDSASRKYISSGDTEVTPAYINSNVAGFGQVICQPPVAMPAVQSAILLPAFTANPRGTQSYSRGQPGLPNATVLYFDSLLGSGSGPRHLVLRFNDDIYVLPSAVTLVPKGPPTISTAAPNGDGSVTVIGAGLAADSLVFFDGLQAAGQNPFNGNDAQGSLTVIPPQGSSGQTSTVTVYNTDGQNTMILQSQNPRTYLYPVTGTPLISNINLTALPASSSAEIDITGVNTNFVDGQVTVGFGSNDVTVRRLWVLSPTRIIANVSVALGATVGASEISVVSGLQVIPNAGIFQTQTARAGFPFIALPLVNADLTQQTVYPGSIVTIYGLNLASSTAPVQLTLNDIPVQLQFSSPSQVNFFIPAGFPTGPATLRLNNGSIAAFPVIVQVNAPPPIITGVSTVSNVSLASISTTVGAGDVLNILATGLDPTVTDNPGRLHVMVSGIDMPVQQIFSLGNGVWQIQIVLTQSFGSVQAPVVVSVDGSSSAPFLIASR